MSSDPNENKLDTLPPPISHQPTRPHPARLLLQRLALFVLGAISLHLLFFPSISPSSSLFSTLARTALSEDGTLPAIEWRACDDLSDRYSCAMYEVPMDYSGKEDGVVKLAMIRYAADEGKERLGSLFMNPGGPGGSGVGAVAKSGPSLSLVAGGGWDIVSWDPRGVGKTEPVYRCFDNARDEFAFGQSFPSDAALPFNLTAYPHALEDFAVQQRTVASYSKLQTIACEAKNRNGIGRFIGTEFVAADLERMGRAIWRNGDVEKGVNYWGIRECKISDVSDSSEETDLSTALALVLRLRYTGMFPDRIGRLIIDGVLNPILWTTGSQSQLLDNSYEDVDKGAEGFAAACVEAGPNRCSLATSPPQSKEELLQTLADLVDQTYEAPLLVQDGPYLGVVTSSMIITTLFHAMYAPRVWPTIASTLKDALEGNGTAILKSSIAGFPTDPSGPASSASSGHAVWCSDSVRSTLNPDATVREIADSYTHDIKHRFSHISRWFGGARMLYTCDGFTPGEAGSTRYTGPFNKTLSNTILLVGNSVDPVTPVANAYFINSIQPQSRVIHQDSFGHASVSAASLCTIKHLRAYFTHGTVPDANVFCSIDEFPFPDVSSVSSSSFGAEGHGEEELRLLEAVKEIGRGLEKGSGRWAW